MLESVPTCLVARQENREGASSTKDRQNSNRKRRPIASFWGSLVTTVVSPSPIDQIWTNFEGEKVPMEGPFFWLELQQKPK